MWGLFVTEIEQWLPVVGCETLYSVSNLGRVRRDFDAPGRPAGAILKGKIEKDTGYVAVTLSLNGKLKTKRVHRLVLEAFVGPCPEGMECCHEDNNRANPNRDNLRWGTRSSNQQDRKRHGTAGIGIKRVGYRRMANAELSIITGLYAEGMKKSDIARAVGVSKAQVGRIINGVCRSRIQGATNA